MSDLNDLVAGTGVAFGTNLEIKTGDLTFLIFYANLSAGLGFDIMLKQYNAYCKGRPNEKIGIDGWYANGQAYAYLEGELGINVNLFFIKKKIPVISAGAAMLLQAKLPNPSWFHGVMGFNYDVLGGLIKGHANFELTLGEKCEFVTDNTLDINEIISEMTPANSANEVSVFTYPQVMFRMPVDKQFEITDINDKVSSYRIRFLDYSISYNNKPAQKISGKIEWNKTKDVLTFIPNKMLPPTNKLKAIVSVTFEEKYSNNSWKKVQDSKMEVVFTTAKEPNCITDNNILYTYPVIGQRYFHPGESKEAYVQLKYDQSSLFTPDKNPELRIISGNKIIKIPFTYNTGSKCIKFTLPQLNLNTKYTVEILGHEKEEVKIGNDEKRTNIQYDTANKVSIRDYSANELIVQKETVVTLLKYDFKTSSFNTFRDKMNGMNKTTPLWEETELINIIISAFFGPSLRYKINGGEPFENVELTGNKYTGNKALVSAYATLSDNFYQSKIKPLLYEKYPIRLQQIDPQSPNRQQLITLSRDVLKYGFPPVKAVNVLYEYLTEVEQGIFNNNAKMFFPYRYDLFIIYVSDFLDLRNQLANAYVLYNRKDYAYLLESSFPAISPGIYEIELKYVFPNGNSGTSSKFTYLYKFNFIDAPKYDVSKNDVNKTRIIMY
jgi:hypothetical protein